MIINETKFTNKIRGYIVYREFKKIRLPLVAMLILCSYLVIRIRFRSIIPMIYIICVFSLSMLMAALYVRSFDRLISATSKSKIELNDEGIKATYIKKSGKTIEKTFDYNELIEVYCTNPSIMYLTFRYNGNYLMVLPLCDDSFIRGSGDDARELLFEKCRLFGNRFRRGYFRPRH